MEPARGEIQTIRAKNSLPEGILNRGKWLKPAGNGIYQAGATYSWDQLESKPNALGLQEMQTGLESMVHQRLEVLERKIGVRPATKDRRPVAGFHPEHHCLGVLNGLGAKGSLMGPWLARHLVEVMREKGPIDREVDVGRFPLVSS